MKKIFGIFLMALFIAGCGGTDDGTEDDLSSTEDKPTETTTEDDMEESTDEPDAD
ncbi:hypothetical protein [Salinicoccus luteus]|uniref:hypothetical protein n=1 Tax=Salinicoccus luteus TaxID=367840 RepID=UPI000A5FA38D|nr:hypothetical protein [Salinicoccus luteus]